MKPKHVTVILLKMSMTNRVYKENATTRYGCEHLTTSASGRALLGSSSGRGRGCQNSRLGCNRGSRLLALGLLRGSVPVEDHLESKDGVEDEAGDESVEDELVVNFLEGCEDSRQRTGQVVKDLSYC